MELVELIAARQSEFLLFAMTPPRTIVTEARAQEIADLTAKRLSSLPVAGLVLYDIDDESERNPQERPFPYVATIDPAVFRESYLQELATPVVVYRAVGKYSEDEIHEWLLAQDAATTLSVLVGAAAREARPQTTLVRAQALAQQTRPDLQLGGVAIPERHTRRGEEHLRLLRKQEAGCSFFVTQVVYDTNASKNLVSDYRYACMDQGVPPVPLIFTFSVCGSLKTLEFLQWLGVDVPRWIQNDLRHAENTLQTSFDHSFTAAKEIIDYCRRMDVPFGINVESVSIRLEEIEASVQLAREISKELRP